MTISPLDASGGTAAAAARQRVPKQTMDSEVFLHLLVTQLANQDPSAPMDTNQMISQTVQLATMERLNTLTAAQQTSLEVQQRTAASSFMGQHVTSADQPPVEGIVTAVTFTANGPVLSVGEKQIALTTVIAVRDPQKTEAPAAAQHTDLPENTRSPEETAPANPNAAASLPNSLPNVLPS